MEWFTVDRKGLSKLLERKGKEFVVYELLQNSLDTSAKRINLTVRPLVGRPLAEVIIEDDDPHGFKDLAHAWTLFAPSEKKTDSSKRGRFNMGEKLVLALATEAEILSTTGGVRFDDEGRHALRRRREKGSQFRAIVRMTHDECARVSEAVQRVIIPAGVHVEFNGKRLYDRLPKQFIELDLPTEVADAEGYLRRVTRKTDVAIHHAGPEGAWVFELGIPVAPFGGDDLFSVDVHQKVPLTMERDAVPPAYLRTLRVAVLNAMHGELRTKDQASAHWVTEALRPGQTLPEAARAISNVRFGENAVRYDPSDVEAVGISTSQGRPVVHGSSLPAEAWAALDEAQALPRAGLVTPSRPEGVAPTDFLTEEQLTEGMRGIRHAARFLTKQMLEVDLNVGFYSAPSAAVLADWTRGGVPVLRFNVGRLGEKWFNDGLNDAVLELLLHEMAHQAEGGHHLSESYHDMLCKLGVKLRRLCLSQPTVMRGFEMSLGGLGNDEVNLLRAGNKIGAIRSLRAHTGMLLKDALELVNAWEAAQQDGVA